MSLPAAPAGPDRCPRCGGGFACGMADASRPCPCTTVRLDAATLAALRARYTGCLCLACLVELAAQGPALAGAPLTGTRPCTEPRST